MIYDRPIWALMKDAAAELSPPYTVGEIVAWFGQHYPRIKASSVRARIKGMTSNDPSRHHYRVSGMTALFVRQPDRTLIPYDPAADTDADDDEEIDEEPGTHDDAALEQPAEFVLEAHLEEFLVGNWKSIRWGRPLEIWSGPNGRSGHQLVTPGAGPEVPVGGAGGVVARVDPGRAVVSARPSGRGSRPRRRAT
jgi:hypothetical protein